MSVLISMPYHEDDLWYNEEILAKISQYRNIQTFIVKDYPIFIYRLKFIPLKMKAHVPIANKKLLHKIINFAKLKKVSILELITKNHNKEIEALPYKTKKSYRASYLIDLTRKEEEIFLSFKSKRRNQINKAIKENVKITSEFNAKIFNYWWDLYVSTVKRGDFVSQKQEFVHDLLENGFCKLFTAWYDYNLISGSVVVCNNYPMWWLGASSRKYSRNNAPSLIQWNIIKWAKTKGYNFLDMGGASLANDHGPTIFKKSFGGKLVKTVHYQIIFHPLINNVLNIFRNLYYGKMKKATF